MTSTSGREAGVPMNETADGIERDQEPFRLGSDAIPGLTPQRAQGPSLKGMLAFGLFIASLLAVGAFVGKKLWDKRSEQQVVKAPDVASAHADKLRLGEPKGGTVPAPAAAAAMASAPLPLDIKRAGEMPLPGVRVPAIKTDQEPQPIGVVASGGPTRPATTSNQQGRPVPNPVDAPMFSGQGRSSDNNNRARAGKGIEEDDSDTTLSRTLATLGQQKARLESMLAQQQAGGQPGPAGAVSPEEHGLPQGLAALLASPGGAAGKPATGAADAPQLLGTLERSATPRVGAQLLTQRALTIPKGTLFSCALKTRVVTATSGFVGCLVQRDVYGHDGKVVLVERGSHLDGEYRMTAVRPGLTRVPVMWTRVLTPHGISVDLESPATGQLGESGLGGHVDNRWFERIGASLLVSLLDDTLKLAGQSSNSPTDGSTVYLSSTTAQGSKLAEEVLKSTINIPPLLYANQGGLVGVYVARDLDFSSVYKLQPQ